MIRDIDRFLYEGSPFLPSVEQEILERILNDLRSDPSYYPGEAIAKHLGWQGLTHTGEVMIEAVKEFKIPPPDVAEYMQGFSKPLLLLQISYAGAADGMAAARQILRQHKQGPDLDVTTDLEYGVSLLRQDPSGLRLIDRFVQRESARRSSICYRIGLEAVRRLFASYSEIITAMGFRPSPFPSLY